MITSGYASPYVDVNATLTVEQRQAASNAGYAVPFISDEMKVADAQRELASQQATIGTEPTAPKP